MIPLVQTILDDKTLVSLGTAFLVLTPIAGAFAWLQAKLSKIDQRLGRIEEDGRDTWNFSQQEAWALRLGKMNPSLMIPDPQKTIRARTDDDE